VFGKGKREKAKNLFENGSKGVGTVMNVQDTGMTVNDNPRVKMVFRIEPLDGSAPFDAEKKSVVSRVQIPRTGDRYPVWYDPTDPTSWAYATVDDDNGRAQLRQLFGEVADTFAGVGAVPTAVPAGVGAAAAADPLDRLKKLDELRAAGVLNDAEFQAKKSEILAEM
jgi:hypothetical protein